jgi:hypothetical protein
MIIRRHLTSLLAALSVLRGIATTANAATYRFGGLSVLPFPHWAAQVAHLLPVVAPLCVSLPRETPVSFFCSVSVVVDYMLRGYLVALRSPNSMRIIMKTIASTVVALSVIVGLSTPASAQSYGYSAQST